MDLPKIKTGWARLSAWPLLIVFLCSETIGPGSVHLAYAGEPAGFSSVISGKDGDVLKALLKLMPENKAVVQSLENGKGSPEDPRVIHLQDAHANPEAQRHIQEVLSFLAEHQARKGLDLFVAVEGARGDLHPEYFDFFPDVPEAGDAVVRDLLEKGEISGVELFAWSQYQTLKKKPASGQLNPVKIRGVETTPLYRENLETYRALLSRRPWISETLEKGKAALQSEMTQTLNPELTRFYKEREKRRHGQFGIRRKDAGNGDLSVYADTLKVQSAQTLQVNLEDPVEQLRFPNFARLLELKKTKLSFHDEATVQGWKQVLELLSKSPQNASNLTALAELAKNHAILTAEDLAAFPSAEAVEEISPRRIFEDLAQQGILAAAGEEGALPFKSALKAIVLQSELDVQGLFEEMDRLENGILNSLAVSPAEKEWLGRIQSYENLQKLMYLEMTRSEFEKIDSRRLDLETLLGSVLAPDALKELKKLSEQAFFFYQQARERDEALVSNALEFVHKEMEGPGREVLSMKREDDSRPILVIVSGGFHAQGIQDVLRKKKLSFASVLPTIGELDRGERYARVMGGENADLQIYFKNANPFLTKQEALFFKEAVEVALPVWIKEKGTSPDSLNEVKGSFKSHPVLSQILEVELAESAVSPALVFSARPNLGALLPRNSSISAVLSSSDIAFSREVEGKLPRKETSSEFRWKPSGVSSAPRPQEIPAGPRAELRSTGTSLSPEEQRFAEQNIQAMYNAVQKSEGPDIVIIVSAQESERRFWKTRLEGLRGQVIGKDTTVFSVLESYGAGSPPGNGLGSLLAYQSAREESKEQAGVSWKTLMEKIKREKGREATIAIYHTAGFGSRVWPITGSEYGSKSRITMPRYLDKAGSKVPMTLLESTIFQSSIFAKNRPGRILVFWGDQVFVPTVPLEELQSPSDSPVEILALVGQFPYEDIINKYGLIALESQGPDGWTAARLMQKPKTVQEAQEFIAAHSQVSGMGKSLGSFTVDRRFWDSMMRSYRQELNEENPLEQSKNRADTDGDWWIPLTSLEFVLKNASTDVSQFKNAKALKEYLVKEGLDQPEFTDRVIRLYLSSRKNSSQPFMKVINAGAKSLWWDFGNVGVEEGTTEGIFRRNILVLLQDTAEGRLARQFWGVPELFTGTLPGTQVQVQNSIITASEILPGSTGAIQNSVISGVRGAFNFEVSDSFLYGITNESASPQSPLSVKSEHGIGYQLKLSAPLAISSGHILAGVPVLGVDVVLRTTEASDAKQLWLRAMYENLLAFGSAAYLIRLAEANRSAQIAGVSVSNLEYRGFFEHQGMQHAVIEGRDASDQPVIAVLHVSSVDQITDAELHEAILSPGIEGAIFSGKLYDSSREILLLTYAARSELRGLEMDSLAPEIQTLLAATADEAALKQEFLRLVYEKLSPEKSAQAAAVFKAVRADKLPYEYPQFFEGVISARTQASGQTSFRAYLETNLSANPAEISAFAADILRAFSKTADFERATTAFFRFDQTSTIRFVDQLIEEKTLTGDKSVTVKSLGTSSGEEPYTLAMIVYYGLKKYYEAHQREISSKEGIGTFQAWAESWNVSIEAYDYDLANLVLVQNGLFDFLYDDPMGGFGYNDEDNYLNEAWLYSKDRNTGALGPAETWRYSPETEAGASFPFRSTLSKRLKSGEKIGFKFSAVDLLKKWMKPVYVDLRGPADAEVLSLTQANIIVVSFLRGAAYLDSKDDYLVQAIEKSRDAKHSSLALAGSAIVKPAQRSELRISTETESLDSTLLNAVGKLDIETSEGVKTLKLLVSRILKSAFTRTLSAEQRTKIADLSGLTEDSEQLEVLQDILDDPEVLQVFRDDLAADDSGDVRFDAAAQTLSYTPGYALAVQADIDEALRTFETGSYVDVQGAMIKLLRQVSLGFAEEVRKSLKQSLVREFEQWRILIKVLETEIGARSELRSSEKTYSEALQFTSRPVVTVSGDSAKVEITFRTDAATLEKSEMFFHWGDYTQGPLDWTDHEILNWDIEDLGGGIYKASKVIQPGRIGEFGVTAYAQNRVTGERVWQGKNRGDDAVMGIDLLPKTVLEDLRRNLKKQEAIQEIRQSLIDTNPYDSFITVIHRLVVDEEMRGMGKIVYDAVKDVPRFRTVLSQIHSRLKEDSKVWNPFFKERALPALHALETLGIGEIVFVAPEGPHAIAGGLAKVIEGLAKALSESGVSVTVITPLYEDNQGKKHESAEALIEKGFMTESGERVPIKADPVAEIGMTFGPIYDSGTHMTGLSDDKIRTFQRTVQSRVYEAKAEGVRYLFLRHPRLADKLYAKVPSSEELRRAVFLSRAALEVVQNRALGVDPQLIISNDWVTGLIPTFLQRDPRYSQDPLLKDVGTVHMIHNYGRDYQGRVFTNQYGLDLWPLLGLKHDFYKDVADPNDDRFLNITSSAMEHVNRSILTVSRPYAEQMLTPEAGEGLDTILNPLKEILFGISNGIDEAAARKTFWKKGEEARQALELPGLMEDYSDEGFLKNLWDYKNSALVKTQKDFGFTEDPDAIFLSMIGRVAEQKGIQLLTDTENGVTVLESLLQMNPKVQIFLGGPVAEGDGTAERLRDLTRELEQKYPGRIRGEYTFIPGATTLQVMLASRFFLMPSRYEPGGITQLESLASGTPVVARNVGGIAATLINYFDHPDNGNGFLFTDFTGAALRGTLAAAFDAAAGDPGLLKTLSNRAANAQNDWHDRIPQYLSLLQLGAGVIRPSETAFQTDYAYLSDRTGILNDLRPRNRAELRSDKGNPYILEENVTRGFAFLDEMHGGRVSTAISNAVKRAAPGTKPRVLLLEVGRGVVPAELINQRDEKGEKKWPDVEFFSSGAEDLLFSAEELEKFMGNISPEEAAVIADTIRGRFAAADLDYDLGAFENSTFDVIVMTQAVMEYMRNIPGVIDRLSRKLNIGGEFITDLDIMSIKDPETQERVDTKAFFESLNPGYEIYGITLKGTPLPYDFFAGLRFTRLSEDIPKIPLDATQSSKTYTVQRSELRAEQASAPQNVRLNGVSPEMLKVEAGELVFWRPSQRQMNTSLKRPYDDEKVVVQKIHNELETLDTLWMQIMGELQERSYSPDALDIVELMVRRAMEVIRTQEIKAEVALRTVKEEMLAAAKEESGDDLDLTTAAGIVDKRLLPALENREELVYVESGLDEEARKKLFIDRERDQVLAKVFEIILRLPYGLHISPEDYGEDEKDRVKKLIHTERQIADGRRAMLTNDLLPEILKVVEQGKRAQFAINQVIKKKVEPGLERLKKMVDDSRKTGGDTLVGSRLIKVFEEQRSLLEGIRDEFDTYDFIYDSSDLPAEKEKKRRGELERFEAVYRDTLVFFPNPSEDLKAFLEELRTLVTYEIRERGRTLDYGIAKFFSQKGSERYKDIPTEQLDFLMRFYNVSQYGIVKRKGDKNLVVFAEKIRHEADFAELMMRNKGRGRVVSIATLKRFAPDDAPGRVPHWFIFSKDQGIVPIEALDFEDRKMDFKDLKDGDFVLVDGKKGIAVVNPNSETQRDMIERGKVYKYLDEYFLPRVSLPALVNGRPFYFWADESRLDYLKRDGDQPRFQKFGARGIGLLRLEQLMGEMDRAGIEFDEMRLSLAIEEMLLPFSDPEAPLTIRLYDVQGDKRPKFFVEGKSEEQIEGILKTHSNIRFYLDEREEFRNQREFGKMQIKAIYRAYLRAQKNNLQILLPNLLKVEEVEALKKLFDEARQELIRELEEEALIQVEAAVVRRHGWITDINALETEALEKGLDWFRNQLLSKPEMKPHEEQFGQESDADFAKVAGPDFGKKVTLSLSKIRFGYMFEEVSAVEQRSDIMKAVLAQHQVAEAKPFFGIGTNDLQKSVLESREETNDEMNKLHPGLVKAIADLEGTARELGLHLTVEGQWGGSARMLFAAMALEIYHGRKMQLVAPTNKIPELLEMIRMTEAADLEHVFDLGSSYKPASMKTLIDRMEAGDLPELDEMNLVATMLQDRIEAKIVASSDFQTFRNLKERQELMARNELRLAEAPDVSSTQGWKQTLAETISPVFSLRLPGLFGSDVQASVIDASRNLGGVYSVAEVEKRLPDQVAVEGDLSGTGQLSREQAAQKWVARQVMQENGLFERSGVEDEALQKMLSEIPELPMRAAEDQGAAGLSAEVHIQMPAVPQDLTGFLPVLAVVASVNGALHLNMSSLDEAGAKKFERQILDLAAEKRIQLKRGQFQVRAGAGAALFASVPQSRLNASDHHALLGEEDVFNSFPKRRGLNLFSLDPAAVSDPGLFASTVITVLQAMALGKQPEDYFHVLNPKSLFPQNFQAVVQAVSTYLAAQARIAAAA